MLFPYKHPRFDRYARLLGPLGNDLDFVMLAIPSGAGLENFSACLYYLLALFNKFPVPSRPLVFKYSVFLPLIPAHASPKMLPAPSRMRVKALRLPWCLLKQWLAPSANTSLVSLSLGALALVRQRLHDTVVGGMLGEVVKVESRVALAGEGTGHPAELFKSVSPRRISLIHFET